MRRYYSTQKRKRKGKKRAPVTTPHFWDETTQRYTTTCSTGKTNKAAAEEWARNQVANGAAVLSNRNMRFRDFAACFYGWDTSAYVKAKRLSENVTRSHIDAKPRNLGNHVLPVSGDFRLSDIAADTIEVWMASLDDARLSRQKRQKRKRALTREEAQQLFEEERVEEYWGKGRRGMSSISSISWPQAPVFARARSRRSVSKTLT